MNFASVRSGCSTCRANSFGLKDDKLLFNYTIDFDELPVEVSSVLGSNEGHADKVKLAFDKIVAVSYRNGGFRFVLQKRDNVGDPAKSAYGRFRCSQDLK